MADRQRVTVTDVARDAGVSTATVVRALRGSPLVATATRLRVEAVARELAYSPNPMARALREATGTSAIGLVTADFTNAFQAAVASGAELELRSAGLDLVIAMTEDDPDREAELAKLMIDRRVGALMMMPDGDGRDYLRPERTYGTPVVLVGRPANGLPADVVMTDEDRAVAEATAELLDRGHRRIGVLAGRAEAFRTTQRLAGFRAAVEEREHDQPSELVITGLETPEQAREAAARLLDGVDPPTAVLALNLGISTGALLDRIANQRTEAFIALDETAISAGLGISAIVRDPVAVGRAAATMVLERLADPGAAPRTVLLPATLVRRGSGELRPPERTPPGDT